jgi:hypothetical protein
MVDRGTGIRFPAEAGDILPVASKPALGSTEPPSGRGMKLRLLLSGEVKNTWNYTSTPS